MFGQTSGLLNGIMNRNFILLTAATLSLCGCKTYQYRIVQPPGSQPVVDKTAVVVHYDPLDYYFNNYHDHLAVNVQNPTDDRIVLEGGRSFAVDPRGESHPLRDQVIGPHSFTRFVLPPIPFTYAYPDYWAWGPGWGWGPAWYDPFWGGAYGPSFYGPPSVSYERVMTVYDWDWKTGLLRLRLSYERNGKTFEHDFEMIREAVK
jgi:hypothetical protein